MPSPSALCEGQVELLSPAGLDTLSRSTRTPCAHCLHRREDQSAVEIGPLDNPRGRRHSLARWQYPLPNEPLEDRGTHASVLRGLRTCQPVGALGAMRQAILLPHARHTVRPPRFARSRPVAQAMERGCNGQVAADFGKLVDELNDIVFGRPAMLPRCMTGHAHLGVHSTVPVQMQARLGWLLSRVDHNLMQHRAHNAFFECLWGGGMVPYGRSVVAQGQ